MAFISSPYYEQRESEEARRRQVEAGVAAARARVQADPADTAVRLVKSWQRVAYTRRLKKLPKALDAIWDRIAGWVRLAVPQTGRLVKRARSIDAIVDTLIDLDEPTLREQTVTLREAFRRGRDKPADVDRAMAVVAVWLNKRLGLRPYVVQIAGALGMYEGRLVEMATGEGKTITATMPAVLWAWRGRGVHVLTSNDYLAKRDADELRPLYHACLLRVAHVDGEMQPDQRREAYAADVTYCTSKEAAADWLRDQLKLGRGGSFNRQLLDRLTGRVTGPGDGTGGLVMRDLAYAIVDEADSLLIDEAVTPLIISTRGTSDDRIEAYRQADRIAQQLDPARHYRVDHSFREARLTSAGRSRIAELAADIDSPIWRSSRVREELVNQAVTAHTLFIRGQHYVVDVPPDKEPISGDSGALATAGGGAAGGGDKEDPKPQVMIVDTNTGRLMPDRKWRGGLHQAVEAKEGIEVTPADETLARISFQRYFRLYRKLCGMSGTVWENRYELHRVFRVPSARIPTNKPCIRQQAPDRFYPTSEAMWDAVAREIKDTHATRRPILVGTRTVSESEELSKRLRQAGLEHVVLNAVHHAEEADVVRFAGQPDRITVATNMAGRGTDIKLGPGVSQLGGLHVIAIGRNDSRRIDRQLYGRAGRQGDPGSARAHIAMDDQMFQRYGLPVLYRWPLMAVRAAQWRAEYRAGAYRQMLLKQDENLREQLGFAGAED